VVVYEYSSETNIWTKVGNDITAPSEHAHFGGYNALSFSADGNRVAIGGPHDAAGTGRYGDLWQTGIAQVFEYNSQDDTWTQLGGNLRSENQEEGDIFGRSVSLSADGNVLAVGAPNVDNANGVRAGRARIYRYENGAWTQVGNHIEGTAEGSSLGKAVSLSLNGNRVAVGIPSGSEFGLSRGEVRVYDYDSSSDTWMQLGEPGEMIGEHEKDMLSASFEGSALTMSRDGNRLAVGSEENCGSFKDGWCGASSGEDQRLVGMVRAYTLSPPSTSSPESPSPEPPSADHYCEYDPTTGTITAASSGDEAACAANMAHFGHAVGGLGDLCYFPPNFPLGALPDLTFNSEQDVEYQGVYVAVWPSEASGWNAYDEADGPNGSGYSSGGYDLGQRTAFLPTGSSTWRMICTYCPGATFDPVVNYESSVRDYCGID